MTADDAVGAFLSGAYSTGGLAPVECPAPHGRDECPVCRGAGYVSPGWAGLFRAAGVDGIDALRRRFGAG